MLFLTEDPSVAAADEISDANDIVVKTVSSGNGNSPSRCEPRASDYLRINVSSVSNVNHRRLNLRLCDLDEKYVVATGTSHLIVYLDFFTN